nr:aminotransferase class I/II-fold pyridoxal phosphate-dependent enzyme [Chitinophagaceae bacterium]
ALLSLCSPQNPTGTTFSKEALASICDMVVKENASRDGSKKLYLLYDQMYWNLTYGNIEHYNPVSLNPAMKEYTIFIDAISKAFAATGVRVGWAMGPLRAISKMKAILTHIGAWAPMAEQKAVAKYLLQKDNVNRFLTHFRSEIEMRLRSIYEGFMALKSEGLPVDAIAPEGAIYLTVRIDMAGKKAGGKLMNTQADVTQYLLDEAGLAIVPFYAFGAPDSSAWYRLSVGTCRVDDIKEMLSKLGDALRKSDR